MPQNEVALVPTAQSLLILVLKAKLINKSRPDFLLEALNATTWTEASTFTVEEWLSLIIEAYEHRNKQAISHSGMQT